MPDYLDAMNGLSITPFTLAVVSGVAAHGRPHLSPDYAPPIDGRGWPRLEAGNTYIAYNQMTAQAEAANHEYINYISYSGPAVNIASLPLVTQQAYLDPQSRIASIEIRDYIYHQLGPVAIVWDSIRNEGNQCALLPRGRWHQIDSKPILEANPGLLINNPTWIQNPLEP